MATSCSKLPTAFTILAPSLVIPPCSKAVPMMNLAHEKQIIIYSTGNLEQLLGSVARWHCEGTPMGFHVFHTVGQNELPPTRKKTAHWHSDAHCNLLLSNLPYSFYSPKKNQSWSDELVGLLTGLNGRFAEKHAVVPNDTDRESLNVPKQFGNSEMKVYRKTQITKPSWCGNMSSRSASVKNSG